YYLRNCINFLIIGTVIYRLTKDKYKDLNLEQLISTPYETLDIRLDKESKTYDIDVQANLSYADKILLASKLLKAVEQYDNTTGMTLNMNVYSEKPTTNSVDFTDEAYLYTIETNGSYTYQYEPLHTEELNDNLLFSTQWEIVDLQLSNNELNFGVILPTTVTPEEANSLLSSLAEEMILYNFENPDKASANVQTQLNEMENYYYLSDQPNYLIYKTRLIG
ncbi:MAG: hypothetical protein K2G70_00335, partial [Turicibacter sp.]|nr:hypothetical protein [Turicibacter sp.]